jgi:hypothetical protein
MGWKNHLADEFLCLEPGSISEEISGRKYSTVGSSLIIEKDNRTMTYISEPLPEASVDLTVEVQELFAPSSGETGATPETIVKNWQLLATSGLSEQSFLFILRLARKKSGWRGSGSKPLEASSLSNFLKFWDKVSEYATEPEFALAPNGNIQAEWYKDERHFLELKFTPHNMIFFGFFDGDKVYEGRTEPDDIIKILSSKEFKPLKWSYEG